MKNAVLFKTLIDIFFFIHVLGIIAFLFKIPFGFFDVENMEVNRFRDWTILGINSFVYFIFLRGLFFLRKLARILLAVNHLSKPLVKYMKKCGNMFLFAGIFSVLLFLTGKFLNVIYEPVYSSFSITPIFLMIIGLFFVIQSRTLSHALIIKNENDLMV